MTTDSGADRPDDAHTRPAGVSDTVVEALGRISAALETVERARGHLHAFHQLTGGADFALDDAVVALRQAGHHQQADLVERELIGRNVIPGHWTFQIVEAYDDTYYRPFAAIEEQLRNELGGGRRHLYEAELKERRRTRGHPDHTARPAPAPAPGSGDRRPASGDEERPGGTPKDIR